MDSLAQAALGVLRIFPVPPEDRLAEEEYAAQLASPTHVLLREELQIEIDQTPLQTESLRLFLSPMCQHLRRIRGPHIRAVHRLIGSVRYIDARGRKYG